IQFLMDGEHSIMDMCELLDLDFFLVRDFVDQFVEKDLVVKKARPVKQSDQGSITKNGIKVE
ncbi:MAG: hypothetical protein AB3N28_10945, partial [Kordiimonas sp.]